MDDERFWSRVDKSGECWEWQGAKDRKGYGRLRRAKIRNSPLHAHRYAWFLTNGEWPECALHRCDNPSCVRPEHLFAGSVADNNRDMKEKRRGVPPPRRVWTHCPQGHEYTPENLKPNGPGKVTCRRCSQERQRAAYSKTRSV